MPSKPRVVCLGTPQYVGKEYLAEFQKTFDFAILDTKDRAETKSDLPKLIAEQGPIDAFIIRMGTPPYEPFDEDLLSPLLPDVRIITSASAGYNEFDVDWMTREGIWFCNTVDAVAEATADMAMWLILSCVRDTYRAERNAREGRWREGVAPSRDVSGMVLGIVGVGGIGKYLAKKALAFNMTVHYHNRHRLPLEVEQQYSATYHSNLQSLLSIADVLSLNLPLNASTTNLISHTELNLMKDDSYIVNTARGAIIDESALIDALESGKLARAGLDVFPNEPEINEYFRSSEKVVVQPHMGGLTKMSFQKAERECFENIKALFKDGRPRAPVNRVGGKRTS